MPTTGHRRAAQTRRRRSSVTRTIIPGLGLLAVLGSAVAVVVQDEPATGSNAAAAVADPESASALVVADPPTTVSRSAERAPLADAATIEAEITGTKFAVKDLSVFADSDRTSPKLASVKKDETVDVTGVTEGGFTQIIHKGVARWVVTASIADEKAEPAPPPPPALSTAPCALGSGVESGLQPDSVRVYRAVCAAFPQIATYGGIGGRGEHATGQAVDIMVSSDLGNQISQFLMDHRAELGVEYIIWRQRIWRPSTSASWRPMSDRGSATANHYDHVHVTTYGASGTL